MNGGIVDFRHNPHPHTEIRRETGPTRTVDHHGGGFNARVAIGITRAVGTMQAAYLFLTLAMIALPPALGLHWLPDRTLVIIAWISQTFIQLVMLAILQLGQNIQSKAADARAQATFLDAEAILHESREIHRHLEAVEHTLRATPHRMEAT